jgi:hypothetical protein
MVRFVGESHCRPSYDLVLDVLSPSEEDAGTQGYQ